MEGNNNSGEKKMTMSEFHKDHPDAKESVYGWIVDESDGVRKLYVQDLDGRIFKYFEGERSESGKISAGKEYYPNGQLKFEGEYLNGKRHGEGMEYDENGQLVFAGEY